MLRRLACAGVGIALLGALVAGVAQGCYRAPEPDCGFVCGSGGACPDDYHCVASENRCHRNGTPETLVCGVVLIDAANPPSEALVLDGPPDGHPDAHPDATPDAMPDAPPDAPPDGPPDAPPDAAPDAPDAM